MSLFNKKQIENEFNETPAKETQTNETLGERIAQARKSSGYTQEEFAQMLNVTAQAVSKWENGNSCPDIQLLPKISEILKISIDELLTGSESAFEPQPEKKKNPDIDISKLKLRIRVLKPDAKPVNVTFPIAMVKKFAKVGNGISGIMGNSSIDGVKMDEILQLVEEGVTGEVLNVVTEDDTNVIIEIS